MNIGNQIKTLRLEKKVKQEELAEYLGVSAQAVSKWETGASTPDITLLPGIATYFGIAIDELFALPDSVPMRVLRIQRLRRGRWMLCDYRGMQDLRMLWRY